MKKLITIPVFAMLVFNAVPSIDYNGESVSFSLYAINEAYAFQNSYGEREDYSIVTEYYVDVDHGDELCSYLRRETVSGSYCDDGWILCGFSGPPRITSVYTGESICVSLDEISL